MVRHSGLTRGFVWLVFALAVAFAALPQSSAFAAQDNTNGYVGGPGALFGDPNAACRHGCSVVDIAQTGAIKGVKQTSLCTQDHQCYCKHNLPLDWLFEAGIVLSCATGFSDVNGICVSNAPIGNPLAVCHGRPNSCEANAGSGSGDSRRSASEMVGNPIYLANGAKYENALDYRSGGTTPLELRRFYRSRTSRIGSLGVAWNFDFDGLLFKISGGSNIGVLTAQGAGYTFAPVSGTSNYTVITNTDSDARLTKNTTPVESYDLVTDDDEMVHYGLVGTDFRMTSIKNRSGYQRTFTYAANGLISSVYDSFGRVLTVNWAVHDTTAAGVVITAEVTSIIAPGGVTITYGYDYDANTNTLPDYSSRRLKTVTTTGATGTPEVTPTTTKILIGANF